MKQFTLLICLTLFAQVTFSQKLYFASNNYTDSAAMAQNIPALARLAIKYYREENKDKYYSTLGYLHIAAKQYMAVNKDFDNYGRQYINDTTQIKVIGFAARVYSHSVMKNQIFDSAYSSIFYSLYSKLTIENSATVDFYFN